MVWSPTDRLKPPRHQARLRRACQQGDSRTIKRLLNRGHWSWFDHFVWFFFGWFLSLFGPPGHKKSAAVDLEYVYNDDEGKLPIHYIAAGPPPSNFITYLVGEDPTRVRRFPIHPAKYDGERAELLRWLHSKGHRFNLNAVDLQLETPLHLALLTKSSAVAKVLLTECRKYVAEARDQPKVAEEDAEGRTPLLLAVRQQQWEAVKLLVAQGALSRLPELTSASRAMSAAVATQSQESRDLRLRDLSSRVMHLLTGHRHDKAVVEELKRALENEGGEEREHHALVLEGDKEVACRRQKMVQHVMQELKVDEASALLLLAANQWDHQRATVAHRQSNGRSNGSKDTGTTAAAAGAVDQGIKADGRGLAECIVCFEMVSTSRLQVPMPCGHVTCNTCWQGVLKARLDDGDVMHVVCPFPECRNPIPTWAPRRLLSRKSLQRFQRLAVQKFVDTNPRIKWCPRPGCNRSLELSGVESEEGLSGGRLALSVTCACGYRFCWNCGEACHEPATCQQAREWSQMMAAAADERKGEQWVEQHTQGCPSCQRRIEKSGGCNHMVCTGCKHEFCWVCLQPWSVHIQNSHNDFYTCRLKPQGATANSSSNGSGHLASPASLRALLGGVVHKLAGASSGAQQQRLQRFLRYYLNHDVTLQELQRVSQHIKLVVQLLPPETLSFPTLLQRSFPDILDASNRLPSNSLSPNACPSTSNRMPQNGRRTSSVQQPQDGGMWAIDRLVEELAACHSVMRNSYIMAYYMQHSPRKRYFKELQATLEHHTRILDNILQQLPHRQQLSVVQPSSRRTFVSRWSARRGSPEDSQLEALGRMTPPALLDQLCYCHALRSCEPRVIEFVEAAQRARERILAGARKGLFPSSNTMPPRANSTDPQLAPSNPRQYAWQTWFP